MNASSIGAYFLLRASSTLFFVSLEVGVDVIGCSSKTAKYVVFVKLKKTPCER